MAERYRFALVGNPNVGKSSLFNALTGLHQHTGNWPGKTVATAAGTCSIDGAAVELIDLPGTYSLSARSPEEEVAAEYISFGSADAVIVVCDATGARAESLSCPAGHGDHGSCCYMRESDGRGRKARHHRGSSAAIAAARRARCRNKRAAEKNAPSPAACSSGRRAGETPQAGSGALWRSDRGGAFFDRGTAG